MCKRSLKVTLIIFGIVFLGLSYLRGFARKNYVFPVLMYHSVNPEAVPENRLAVTPRAFDSQMAFLKRFHYNVLPLEDAAKLIKAKKGMPARSVAITFDDGYQDNYAYAFPILKKYNFPATVFIITQEVGRINPSGIKDRLSWGEIKTMQDSGLITFGSHTLGPEPLVNIESEEEIRRQIFYSKKALEDKLGRSINLFSYPEGKFNKHIRQLVIDAGYQAAVVTSPGAKFASNDTFAIKRLRISSTSNNPLVFWIETSGLYTFIKERRDDR